MTEAGAILAEMEVAVEDPDHEDERNCVGGLLAEGATAEDVLKVAAIISPDDLAMTAHKLVLDAEIAVASSDHAGEYNRELVLSELRHRGHREMTVGIWADLCSVPSAASASYFACQVQLAASRRELRLLGLGVAARAEKTDLHALLAEIEGETARLRSRSSGGGGAATWRTFGDILEADAAKPREFLVPGVVAFGAVTLFVGKPKTAGKSTFAWGIVAAAEHGSEFMGSSIPLTKAVILAEDGEHDLADRIRRFRLPRDTGIVLSRSSLRGTPDLGALVREAVARGEKIGAKILLVDTFAFWAALDPSHENDAGVVTMALRPLQKAADAGWAVLIVHHVNRRQDVEGGEAARGSTAFAGSVEAIVEIRRVAADGGNLRKLHLETRFGGVQNLDVELRDGAPFDELDRFDLMGDSEEVVRKDVDAAIIAWVEANPGDHRREDIAGGVDKRRAHVLAALPHLYGVGKLQRKGDGKAGDPHLYSMSVPSVPVCSESGPEPDSAEAVPGHPPPREGGDTSGNRHRGESAHSRIPEENRCGICDKEMLEGSHRMVRVLKANEERGTP